MSEREPGRGEADFDENRSAAAAEVVCKNYLFPHQLIMMGVFAGCTPAKKVLIFYASLTGVWLPAARGRLGDI